MKHLLAILTITFLSFSIVHAQTQSLSSKAIVDVNVISMESEKILEHQTVFIEGDRISKIEPSSKITFPASTLIIDGRGKYLIPGLMDMHVHLNKKDLPLYIANGITTVRNLNGDTTHLSMRTKINQGLLFGPRLYTSGPLITGPETEWSIKIVPTSLDDVRRIVRDQKKAGYDLIKVYDGLTKNVYEALMEEAHRQGMRVVGHIPETVGLMGVLEKGQAGLEHLDKIIYTYFQMKLDTIKIPEVAAMIKKAGVWVTPTLASQEIFQINAGGGFAPMLNNPEMAYVSPGIMGWWKSFAKPSPEQSMHGSQRQDFWISEKLAKAFYVAGIPLLAGTDNPNPGMVPGYSLHEELRNLVAAGLSNYDALKTATVNGAIFLKMQNQFGLVKEGMIADLVLLYKNPLVDIASTKQRIGVMVKGNWYAEKDLKSILEKSFKR